MVDNRRKFQRNWETNWPATLQYVRSTKTPNDVIPELHKPVQEIAYNFAVQSGQLPTVESLYQIYNHCLEKIHEKRVENFFGNKAKRQQRKAKRKERRAKRKAAGEKVGLGRFIQNIGRGVVNLKLLPLAPFKGVMRKALSKEGVAVGRKAPMREIVSKFLRFVVKKEAPKYYPDQAVIELDSIPDDAEGIAIGPIITTVIQAVKGFLEHLQAKKAQGEKLSNTETDILVGADRAAREFEQIKREEVNQEVGFQIRKNWPYALLGLLVVAYVFTRK